MQYSRKIDTHDFEYKTKHVREFLGEGNKVKVVVKFRGREMAHPEFGREILTRVVESTKDLCSEEVETSRIPLIGRFMSIMLSPSAKITAKVSAAAAAD